LPRDRTTRGHARRSVRAGPSRRAGANHLIRTVLRQDDEALDRLTTEPETILVSAKLGLSGRVPTAFGLDDHVNSRRLELDIGKAAVSLAVFLELDGDRFVSDGP
jgi:hypothetical protein